MPRRVATDDDWDEDEGEGWTPDDDDKEWVPDDAREDDTVPCPHCQEPVYDQSEQCPHCGQYITEEDASPTRWPAWIAIGFVLALVVAILWAL